MSPIVDGAFVAAHNTPDELDAKLPIMHRHEAPAAPARAARGAAEPPPRERRLTVTDGQSFLAHEFAAPPWLVEPYLPAGGLSVISGLPKSCKSWISLDLCLAVVSGGPWLGKSIDQAGTALLIDAETPAAQLQERIRQLAAGRRITPEDLARLRIVDRTRIDLDRDEDMDDLRGVIAEHAPAVIVLDPLCEFHQRDENSPAMAGIMAMLREWTHGGGTLCVVHHHNKSDQTGRRIGASLRGHNSIWGAYDSGLYIRRDEQDVLVNCECRYVADQPQLTVQLDVNDAGPVTTAKIHVLDLPEVIDARADRIMELLEDHPDGLAHGKIKDCIGASGGDTTKTLHDLKDRGLVSMRKAGSKHIWKAEVDAPGGH